ncbi:hypothetical protein MMALV_13870 [Candidatus Methanomethylophilus alvi Mx1201]|uniref:Uncharacterized protein n=2 Tax=Methanomethylophilus alvi TaxID=1291540 RepID=M9SJ26_METAX|nr:hypothetical protein [Methanomethylophilus alvi]AGI86113.1 hypothetical protein MMALV_13870 [Candidatus Methanomethylophilus alvi Mx1201]AYQ55485.1 hypothetical protein BKD89_06720 [Methanomethylophilus alvi]
MMSGKKGIVFLLAALMALVTASAVVSDGSDASPGMATGSAGEFKDGKDGTITFLVNNDTGGEIEATFKVYVDIAYGDITESTAANVTMTQTLADGQNTVKISFSMGDGDHTVTVTASSDDATFDAGANHFTLNISVAKSIWSNVTTYLALIAIVLIVVIAAFYYIRTKPKAAPSTTFTELEEKKKAEKPEEPARKSVGTERRRYNSKANDSAAKTEESKPAPVQVEEKKKAASFTELEEEKKTSKPSDSSKKIKYVSSRRK